MKLKYSDGMSASLSVFSYNNFIDFIGLEGVKDYETFWNALELDKKLISGEIQVSNGFKALIEKDLLSKTFTWFDTGTPESYSYILKNYPHGWGYNG